MCAKGVQAYTGPFRPPRSGHLWLVIVLHLFPAAHQQERLSSARPLFARYPPPLFSSVG